VFISAATKQMDALKDKDLIDGVLTLSMVLPPTVMGGFQGEMVRAEGTPSAMEDMPES
jgi:hypothetical protein